jgi:anthranilate phosphoribosyltransferase
MKTILEYLLRHNTLTREDAHDALVRISEGTVAPEQVSAFLTVFRMRGITVSELQGFRDALLSLCVPLDLSEFDPVDLCGTGGDGKDTFNISTLAAFVTAGAGVPVAKHGNYGVSSLCGSSNVLEAIGYRFTQDTGVLKRQLEKCGICFLHAPLFHPAMKAVAPVRRNLGLSTFFNMLGPMVNPSRPSRQMTGVYSLELLRLYHHLYENTPAEYRLVHSLDGYDEVSLTGLTRIIRPGSVQVAGPEDFGSRTLREEELAGGDSIASAAEIFLTVLSGKGTAAQQEVVCANAAVAIQCRHPEKPLTETMQMARESLASGKAYQTLQSLLNL